MGKKNRVQWQYKGPEPGTETSTRDDPSSGSGVWRTERTGEERRGPRCAAHRRSGAQCSNRPIRGGVVCRMHGGAAKQVQRKARERIALTAEIAVVTIADLMRDESMPPAIRLRAAMDFLDRNQIAGKTELVVEDKRYERLMGGITRERPANVGPAPEARVGGLSRARPSFGTEREIPPAPPGTLALPPAEREVTVGDVLDVVEAELVEERPPVVPPNPMASFEELYGDVPNPMDPPLYGRARLGRSEYGA